MRHFINLTNGIEAFNYLNEEDKDRVGFVRIQSTAAEQKRWWFILHDLDHTLLMSLAMGEVCVIHDFSNRKESPRALYQGVEWIKFALYRIWLHESYVPNVRGNNCQEYFRKVLDRLDVCDANEWRDKALKKLLYYKKQGFVLTDEIRLYGEGSQTNLDGKKEEYANILRNEYGYNGIKQAKYSPENINKSFRDIWSRADRR